MLGQALRYTAIRFSHVHADLTPFEAQQCRTCLQSVQMAVQVTGAQSQRCCL